MIDEAQNAVVVLNSDKRDVAPDFDAQSVWKIIVGGTKLSRGTAAMRRSTKSALTPLVRSWLSIIALRALSCPPSGRSSTIVTSLKLFRYAGRALRLATGAGNAWHCRKWSPRTTLQAL